jgi:O-antigen/teichoic acid export membrane protein
MNDIDPITGPSTEVVPPTATTARRGSGTTVSIVRNSMWLTIDTLVSMAGAFYCSILVARQLGPDFMGQYNYVLYFATVLKMVTDLAIPVTVRKFSTEFIGKEDYGSVRTLVRRAMWLQLKLAGAGVAVGIGIVLATFPNEQRAVGALAVLSIIPSMLLGIPSGALWAAGNVRPNVLSSLLAIAVNIVGTTVSVLMGWGLVGLTGSLLLSRAIDFALRYALFRQTYARLPGIRRTGPLDPALRGRMIRFAGQQVVLALLYALLFDRMEVFFLKGMAPSREIAFFSISFTLVSYLLQFPQNLADSASIRVWVEHGRSPAEAARTTAVATWFVMLFAAPALFGVAAVSDPLLSLLYGAKYLPAIPVLAVLAVVSLSLAVSQPSQLLLVGAGRNGFYIVWLCVAGIVAVAGNFLLIPAYGAVGAAFAKGAGQATAAVGFVGYVWIRFQARPPLWRMARLLLACAAMAMGVRLVGRALPSILALVVGVPLGAVLFVLFARWLRFLDGADGERLRQLARLVPSRARGSYGALVDFLVHV